jgi:hypothetical protein
MMNARLKSLLRTAETRLAPADQAELADLPESFVASHEGDPDFTPEELDRLRRIDTEPFTAADPAAVAALFARRG